MESATKQLGGKSSVSQCLCQQCSRSFSDERSSKDCSSGSTGCSIIRERADS